MTRQKIGEKPLPAIAVRGIALLVLSMLLFFPVSIVIAVWQWDWRWVVTGVVSVVIGFVMGEVIFIQSKKKS